MRKLYTEALVGRGDITEEEYEEAHRDFQDRLERAFAETHAAQTGAIPVIGATESPTTSPRPATGELETTGVARRGRARDRRRVRQQARRASRCTPSSSSCSRSAST